MYGKSSGESLLDKIGTVPGIKIMNVTIKSEQRFIINHKQRQRVYVLGY